MMKGHLIALAQRAGSSDREVYEVYGGAQRPVYSDSVAARSTKRDQSNKSRITTRVLADPGLRNSCVIHFFVS
jgi:hypothetical protein